MAGPFKWNEKDKENLVEFLNFVSDKAEFKVNTQDVIKYFKLLAWAQQELLKKVEDSVVEITKVHKPEEEKK